MPKGEFPFDLEDVLYVFDSVIELLDERTEPTPMRDELFMYRNLIASGKIPFPEAREHALRLMSAIMERSQNSKPNSAPNRED